MSVQTHTLANGVQIVTEHMPGLASAAIGLWVGAGGRHERAAQTGVAHFLEHMAFKGTRRRSTLEIAEAIEDVGGAINAYTSREATAYYARVLKEDVALALDVIGDIVLDPLFAAEDVEVERGVILQEIGQARDTPDDIVFDWLQEAAYRDQAIGRSILGPAGNVGRFTRDDLFGFVREQYAPERMIVSAAGAVDHEEIVRLAEASFGHLPRVEPGAVTPAAFTGGEHRTDRDLEQVHFALAFESPGSRDPALYTAQVYATAMGGGMSSRLFQELRERRGLCYTVFAQAGAWADTGMLTLYAGTGADEIAGLADQTLAELRRAGEGLRGEEVARARTQLRAGLLMELESPSARAERQAHLLSTWGRVPEVEETIAAVEAVTPADIRDFAAGLVTSGSPALALYGPLAGAPDLAGVRERLAA